MYTVQRRHPYFPTGSGAERARLVQTGRDISASLSRRVPYSGRRHCAREMIA